MVCNPPQVFLKSSQDASKTPLGCPRTPKDTPEATRSLPTNVPNKSKDTSMGNQRLPRHVHAHTHTHMFPVAGSGGALRKPLHKQNLYSSWTLFGGPRHVTSEFDVLVRRFVSHHQYRYSGVGFFQPKRFSLPFMFVWCESLLRQSKA